VLQAGSAIEREFTYELIKAVAELPEQELLHHLSVLKDTELLYERGIFPQSTYVFRHAITREVIYNSILAKRKKRLHEKIGKAIEELYRDNIGDHYGILAEHFLAGENYEKAAQYAKLASKKAEKMVSVNDAILYAEKGISCLERLPGNDQVRKKIIDARTVLGLYLVQIGNPFKAKEAIDPIMEAAAQQGLSRRLAQIYIVTGAYACWVEEDFPRALEHLSRALALAEEVGDIVSLLFATYWLALALAMECRFQEAFSFADKSLTLHTAIDNQWGVSMTKSHQSFFQWLHGRVDLSYRTGHEALELAEQSGDTYSRTLAHTYHGISCYGLGAFEEAIDHLSKGVDLAEGNKVDVYVTLARFFLAETYLELGDYEVAKNHCRKSVELLERIRLLPSWANLNSLALAKARVLSGEKNDELDRLYRYVRDNRIKIYEGWSRRYLSEILLIIDDQHFSEAQHWIEEAIEADRRNQMMFHLGRDYAVYADLFRRKGDEERAKEQLGKAIDI
jgi:tetratricopeptide (TPR) repeat protein